MCFRASPDPWMCLSGESGPTLAPFWIPMTSLALRHGFLEGEGQAQPQVPRKTCPRPWLRPACKGVRGSTENVPDVHGEKTLARIPILSTSRSSSSKNLKTTLLPQPTRMVMFLTKNSKSLPSVKGHTTFLVALMHVCGMIAGGDLLICPPT